MAHNNMLFYLVLLVLSTDFCLGQTLSTCNKVYVWEFADPLGERSVITRELTNEVEEILTQKNCLILQRRNYERLGRHAGNEKGVKGVEGLSTELTHELKFIEAELVLFGEVKMDDFGNLSLRVSIEQLLSKRILRSSSFIIKNESAFNKPIRQAEIERFITKLIENADGNLNPQEEKKWNEALFLSTKESLMDYIVTYPSGKYVITARQKLETLSVENKGLEEEKQYQKAKIQNTARAYSEYLKLYPKGRYVGEIAQNPVVIKDNEKWADIVNGKKSRKKKGNIIDYINDNKGGHIDEANNMLEDILWNEKEIEVYVTKFPTGKHIDIALDLYEDQLFQTINSTGNEEAVSKYFSKFSNGKYTNKLEEIIWGHSKYKNTVNAVKIYLKYYPNGRYVSEAERLIHILVAYEKEQEKIQYEKKRWDEVMEWMKMDPDLRVTGPTKVTKREEAIRTFMLEFPQQKSRIDEAFWLHLNTKDEKRWCDDYKKFFPNGRYLSQVNSRYKALVNW